MINAIYLYRVARWFYIHRVPVLPSFITILIRFIYNSYIPHQAQIGKGTILGYGGMSVVIHRDAVIGENCIIAQCVTIGGGNYKYPGVPYIGNNVRINCGSCICGGITVGNNVEIGANSVVNRPCPDNVIVAGTPARVLRYIF